MAVQLPGFLGPPAGKISGATFERVEATVRRCLGL